MGTDMGGSAGKIFDITFALTDAEIKLLTRISHVKRMKIAPLGKYLGWIVIVAGIILSFLSGAIAHRYYGVELNSNASTLVTAVFFFFLAGSYADRWLIRAWLSQASAHRVQRLKQTARARIGEDRIAYFAKDRETQTSWDFIENVTISGGTVVLWVDPDTALMIPLRAISPPEDSSVFVETIKAWIEAAAARKTN
jgi:hypothetical protein